MQKGQKEKYGATVKRMWVRFGGFNNAGWGLSTLLLCCVYCQVGYSWPSLHEPFSTPILLHGTSTSGASYLCQDPQQYSEDISSLPCADVVVCFLPCRLDLAQMKTKSSRTRIGILPLWHPLKAVAAEWIPSWRGDIIECGFRNS